MSLDHVPSCRVAAGPPGSRSVDLVVAAGLLGLALRAATSLALGWMGLAVAALYLVAALACLRRLPATSPVPLTTIVLAVPGVLVGGVALALAGPLSQWPAVAQAVFAAGALVTLAALWTLRDHFGVLPAHRGLTTRGLYRRIRHPMYAGQLAMLGGAALAMGGIWGAALAAGSLGAVTLRTWTEERVLATDPGWGAYCREVRWWWVPGLL